MRLDTELGRRLRRPALIGLGPGLAGAAVLLTRNGTTGLGAVLPGAPGGVGSFVVPFVSLLALVGPTGLTFPCWANDAHAPGVRAWHWLVAHLGK
ncbi:MAG TPA: hypothetical protein VGP88_02920 [Thermoplasmata archaeon]|jgi:hypothetical protein|nr:hypothetical protein [Thermoplasmata archaeon]